MSLIKKRPVEAPRKREALVTESDALEGVRAKNRAYQKEHRAQHLDRWKKEKATVDQLSGDGLRDYISSADDTELRVGLHSMKVSAKEAAIIKLALEMTGARSSREMYIDFCKKVINKGN